MITRKITVVRPNSPTQQAMRLDVIWFEVSDLDTMHSGFPAEWYATLKESIVLMHSIIRPPLCLTCGRDMVFDSFDLHHGIVSKQDIRGWRFKNARMLIDTELNLIPLHIECHRGYAAPTREEVWEYQSAFYGQSLLIEWYKGLPWKTPRPPRLFRGVEYTKEAIYDESI